MEGARYRLPSGDFLQHTPPRLLRHRVSCDHGHGGSVKSRYTAYAVAPLALNNSQKFMS